MVVCHPSFHLPPFTPFLGWNVFWVRYVSSLFTSFTFRWPGSNPRHLLVCLGTLGVFGWFPIHLLDPPPCLEAKKSKSTPCKNKKVVHLGLLLYLVYARLPKTHFEGHQRCYPWFPHNLAWNTFAHIDKSPSVLTILNPSIMVPKHCMNLIPWHSSSGGTQSPTNSPWGNSIVEPSILLTNSSFFFIVLSSRFWWMHLQAKSYS